VFLELELLEFQCLATSWASLIGTDDVFLRASIYLNIFMLDTASLISLGALKTFFLLQEAMGTSALIQH
jgi:hypothetical protein